MSIIIKTPEEITIMREGGKILREILMALKEKCVSGIKTCELDRYAEELFEKFNVLPSFKGYNGYPSTICTSVNEEVVHAIPSNRTLNDGDIISIDAGVFHKNFHTDSAITIKIGHVSEDIERFIKTCKRALDKAIEIARPGIHVTRIGAMIQRIVEDKGYSIIKDLIGHGVGHKLHEDPEVPNFKTKNPGPILQEGMTIAIEPIIAMGNPAISTLNDGWTIVTRDKSHAIQVEHTIAITKNGSITLTN